MLEKLMGKNGIEIWKRANGIDSTPVFSYSEQKSISTEHTFEKDTTDLVRLNQLLVSMVEKIAFELQKTGKTYLLRHCQDKVFELRYTHPAETDTLYII